MKFNAIALAAIACFALGAQAQTARPAVRAASEPMNEASLPSQYKGTEPRTSEKTRAQVKAETKAANVSGPAGQGERSMPKNEAARKSTDMKGSTRSREEVKAEAKAAAASGPAGGGERSVPRTETPRK